MQIFASPSVSRHYFHQMKLCMKDHINVLPPDIAIDLPGYACLLGNLLEVAGLAFAQPESFTMVKTKEIPLVLQIKVFFLVVQAL